MPSVPGLGKFRDITKVHKGMGPNEVRSIMGSNPETVFEEGLQGIDAGNYIWVYPEGRVYFNLSGVVRVAPVR